MRSHSLIHGTDRMLVSTSFHAFGSCILLYCSQWCSCSEWSKRAQEGKEVGQWLWGRTLLFNVPSSQPWHAKTEMLAAEYAQLLNYFADIPNWLFSILFWFWRKNEFVTWVFGVVDCKNKKVSIITNQNGILNITGLKSFLLNQNISICWGIKDFATRCPKILAILNEALRQSSLATVKFLSLVEETAGPFFPFGPFPMSHIFCCWSMIPIKHHHKCGYNLPWDAMEESTTIYYIICLCWEHSLGFWWAQGHPVLHPISWHFPLDLLELHFYKKTGQFWNVLHAFHYLSSQSS